MSSHISHGMLRAVK